jgi:intracellular septation protein
MKWVRTFVDYAAALAFLGTVLLTRNFELATWVLVGASAIALAVGWIAERKLAPLPLFSGALALIFGGLTLIFHDSAFVKMKMTVVDLLLAGFLISGLWTKRHPLKVLVGDALIMSDAAWRTLTMRYAIFFFACAVINEVVWRTQPDDKWAIWRLVAMGAALAFSVSQTPFLMKHLQDPDKAQTPEPPEAGF